MLLERRERGYVARRRHRLKVILKELTQDFASGSARARLSHHIETYPRFQSALLQICKDEIGFKKGLVPDTSQKRTKKTSPKTVLKAFALKDLLKKSSLTSLLTNIVDSLTISSSTFAQSKARSRF